MRTIIFKLSCPEQWFENEKGLYSFCNLTVIIIRLKNDKIGMYS